MRTPTRLLTMAAAGIALAGPNSTATGQISSANPGSRQATPQVQAIAAADNAFATDFYAHIKDQPGNLFFSPVSIQTALSMAAAGARGDTQMQMNQALHLADLDPQAINPAFGALQQMLQPADQAHPAYQLSTANALWIQNGFPLEPNYVAAIKSDYDGKLDQLDFTHASAAAKTINDWVADKTHDKIKDLISPDALNALTRLVLTNAVYFKGTWENPFEATRTLNEPFTTAGGSGGVSVPMMRQTHTFGYAQTDSFQVLEMPYQGNDLDMIVLLPREAAGMEALEKSLTAKNLAACTKEIAPRDVNVTLPRFKTTQQLDLNSILEALGMTNAFNPRAADFSGIASHEPLYIGMAVHKAYVDVNEQGTEAAAATGITMRAMAIMRPPAPPVIFRADHPFLFLIRHQPSGAILFLGRVNDRR